MTQDFCAPLYIYTHPFCCLQRMYFPYTKHTNKSKQALGESTANCCGTFSCEETYAHYINYICLKIDTQPREIYSWSWLWLWNLRAINTRSKLMRKKQVSKTLASHTSRVIANNWTVSMRKRFPKHLRACVSVRINKLLNIVAIPWSRGACCCPLASANDAHYWPASQSASSMAMTSNSSLPLPSPLYPYNFLCHCNTRMLCCSPPTAPAWTRVRAILLKIYGEMQTNKLRARREKESERGRARGREWKHFVAFGLGQKNEAEAADEEEESLKRCDRSWFSFICSLAWQSFLLIFERIPVRTTAPLIRNGRPQCPKWNLVW